MNHEQFLLGAFYGTLVIIIITYFFFSLALKEMVFLYYVAYVLFVGLCLFSFDGLYHQYLGGGTSWLKLHFEIISLLLASLFFTKYSENILNVKENNPAIHQFLKAFGVLLGLVLLCVILYPGFIKFAYTIVSIIILCRMLLILFTIGTTLYKKQRIDWFHVSGIFILFMILTTGNLINFKIFPPFFLMHDLVKPGIGAQVIVLSLSTAKRIRLLKSKEQEHQAVALQKAEELNDVKSYFLSSMSHELRTPLNVILGLVAVMENESDDAKIKANCEVIKYASKGLLSSVNDILDFSRIGEGELKLDKSEFCLYESLYELAESARKQSLDKGITFGFQCAIQKDVYVIGDRSKLEQIIYNVLGNAIKFTSEGDISFNISSTSTVDTIQLNIIIKDTGVGIPEEKLATIFELFSQTDFDNKRRYGGFGIGLSIVKSLIDLHHGNIKINSISGHGTTCEMTISYPLHISKENLINKYPADDYDLMGKHILVVEDNLMNQMIIEMMMGEWKNTKISMANDGSECLEFIKKQPVDLILLDLQMPVMDGYEVISALKNGRLGAINIPIIVLTADTTVATKERILSLDIADYMYKPLDEKMLYQKITSALSKRSHY